MKITTTKLSYRHSVILDKHRRVKEKMFKKKKEKRTIRIIKDGIIIFDGELYELPIKDERIISGSIEFFNDPEPCMIHRSAVISKYYMQIENWLDDVNYENDTVIKFSEIPNSLAKLVEVPADE